MYSTAFFTALIAATTAIAIPVGSNDNVFSAVVNKRSLDARRHGTIQGSKPLRPAPATGAASGTGAQGKHTWSGTHGSAQSGAVPSSGQSWTPGKQGHKHTGAGSYTGTKGSGRTSSGVSHYKGSGSGKYRQSTVAKRSSDSDDDDSDDDSDDDDQKKKKKKKHHSKDKKKSKSSKKHKKKKSKSDSDDEDDDATTSSATAASVSDGEDDDDAEATTATTTADDDSDDDAAADSDDDADVQQQINCLSKSDANALLKNLQAQGATDDQIAEAKSEIPSLSQKNWKAPSSCPKSKRSLADLD